MTLPEGLPVLMKLDKLVGKLLKKGLSPEDMMALCEDENERALLKVVWDYREEARPIELSAQNLAKRMESCLVDTEK